MFQRILKSKIKSFISNKRGNFAIITGGIAVPLIFSIGLAIDYNRLMHVSVAAQNAAHAAALAAVQQSTLTDEQLTEYARSYFMTNLTVDSTVVEDNIAVVRDSDGRVDVTMNGKIESTFMKIADYPKLNFGATSAAAMKNRQTNDLGCIYLTDPRNTGLDMKGTSNIASNCVVMITSKNKAIDISGTATASFGSICATGSITAPKGQLTPSSKIKDCEVVVDPFANMVRPIELSGACSSNSDIEVKMGETLTLSNGIHCGDVQVKKGGTLVLAAGVHYFKGELYVKNDGTLKGDEVLLAFDKGVSKYELDGTLNVNGLKSGPYKGFVIYHEDYIGYSNTLQIGVNANFLANGVIYLPNTNIKISNSINEFATQSILVTDRIELAGNAAFKAVISSSSDTPLPNADLSVRAKSARLVN